MDKREYITVKSTRPEDFVHPQAGREDRMTHWSSYHTKQKDSKYKSKKTEVDGIEFMSKKEARRYTELKLLERAGEISDLRLQVKYVLIPAQREPDTVGAKGGVKKGKVIERECSYVADFVYRIAGTSDEVVEDTKGFRTPEYKIKRKLMLWVHGIRIREI